MYSLMMMLIAIVPMDGWLSWLNKKSSEGVTTVQGIAMLVAVGFVVFIGVKSKGSMAAILGAALSAALLLWVVNNMTAVKDRTDGDLKESLIAPAGYSQILSPGR